MFIPALRGQMKRAVLVNYRADPGCVQRLLPRPFRPKLHNGFAVITLLLVRLEQVRAAGLPKLVGYSSENAAHQIAVEWTEPGGLDRLGMFIPRRDTNSKLNRLAGARCFPGEYHPARFTVVDTGGHIDFSMQSLDRRMTVRLVADESDTLPPTSCFNSPAEASAFFNAINLVYSFTREPGRLEGVQLLPLEWRTRPLAVTEVYSSFLADRRYFLEDYISFDHALILRDVPQEWHSASDLRAIDALAPTPTLDPEGRR